MSHFGFICHGFIFLLISRCDGIQLRSGVSSWPQHSLFGGGQSCAPLHLWPLWLCSHLLWSLQSHTRWRYLFFLLWNSFNLTSTFSTFFFFFKTGVTLNRLLFLCVYHNEFVVLKYRCIMSGLNIWVGVKLFLKIKKKKRLVDTSLAHWVEEATNISHGLSTFLCFLFFNL